MKILEILNHIYKNGEVFDSRIGMTTEMMNFRMKTTPTEIVYRPGMSRSLGFVEVLQVLSGYFDERQLRSVAPNLLYDYGITHAYGIKIAHQIPKVIDQLKNNPGTRRAIIYIGKPEDGFEEEKPCIQSIQFLIRKNSLHATVFVRSWDVISGLPYDTMVVGALTQIIADFMDLDYGKITWNATSAHYYDVTFDKMIKDFSSKPKDKDGKIKIPYSSFFVDVRFETWNDVREWAIDQLNRIEFWIGGVPDGIFSK